MDFFCRLFGAIFAGVAVFILVTFGAVVLGGGCEPDLTMLPMLILPVTFITVGLTVFFAPTRRKRRLKKLMNEGDHLIATITEVSQSSSVRVNNMRQWRFYATAMDPVTGEMRMFHSSRDYGYDPTPLLIRSEVDVYVHPTNRERYAMDDSSAMR